MNLRSLWWALLILAVLGSPASARACAITVSIPLKYAFKQSQSVFLGTVKRIDVEGTMYVAVREQWKGAASAEIRIPRPRSNCAESLTFGHDYLVVTNADGELDGSYSHVEDPALSTTKLNLVRKRARWWRSPLSSLTWRGITSRESAPNRAGRVHRSR